MENTAISNGVGSDEGASSGIAEANKPNNEPVETDANSKVDELNKNIEILTADNNSLKEENNRLTADNNNLKIELAITRLGIKEDCKEDALTLAKPLVNEKCDIFQALRKVIEKYPDFAMRSFTSFGGVPQISFNDDKVKDGFVAGVKNKFIGRR